MHHVFPQQESETIEFKQSLSETLIKKSTKTVVAFANTHGWVIYFGIDDIWNITWWNAWGDKEIQKIANVYHTKIDPRIYTSIEVIKTHQWDIIKVSVHESKRKIHTVDSVWYSRVGTTNQPRDKDEYQQRLIDTSWLITTWSWSICHHARLEDIDHDAIEYFIHTIIKQKLPQEYKKYKQMTHEDILTAFGLITPNHHWYDITNDCLLLLWKEQSVDTLLWEYAIKYRYTESWDFSRAFVDGVAPDRAIRYPPLITALAPIEQKINSHNHYLAESHLFRAKSVRQYDDVTIREVIMNAITHNDRSREWFIEISQSINSLRCENQGEYQFDSLHDLAQNPNQYKNYRNKFLAKLLFRLWFIEREASGIIAKIVRKQQEKWLPLPRYSKIQWRTRVDLTAKVIDTNFAKIIMQHHDMNINDLIILDMIIQGKDHIGIDLTVEDSQRLRTLWYIEIIWSKHKKKARISQTFATRINKKWLYSKAKWLPRKKAFMLIDEHIETFGSIKKSEARDLLPDLTDDQIYNLLKRSWKYILHKEWHPSHFYYTKQKIQKQQKDRETTERKTRKSTQKWKDDPWNNSE